MMNRTRSKCRSVTGLAGALLAALLSATLVSPGIARAEPGAVPVIYPLARAEILAGSRFDLKVEFPGTVEAKDITVTINGEDAAQATGATAQVIPQEDGNDLTAYWLRQTSLPKAGRYVVEARAGNAVSQVAWEVFGTPKGRIARNVILFIGDGMAVAHRTAARILSKGLVEGRYGGELAIDDMPYMALVSTSGSDSVVTDSANSMSAYTTGHKSCNNAMGAYCARNKNVLDHPRVENLTELVQRKLGLAVGVVTNTEIEDATPAAMVAHTRRRMDYDGIVRAFDELKPEVIMGGGWPNWLPRSDKDGRRADEVNYIEKLKSAGYAFVNTNTELSAAAAKPETTRLLGLFNKLNIDGALDRRILKKGTVPLFPDQPDLTDEVRTALEVLTRNDKGFLLMVESGRIDKFTHSLDWERAVYDTIMLDDAVKVAKEFAGTREDTLIIVVPDHAHPISIIGTYDDAAGESVRDKLQLYDRAKFPNYQAADKDGYPPSPWVSRRLALVFAAFPDNCETGRPHVEGENVPAVAAAQGAAADDKDHRTMVANEANCAVPGAIRRVGNLPFVFDRGVHSADDVILTATGPGADQFHGRIDNTRVFRAIATALGLGSP